jgi:hypothetical protein
MKIGLIDYRKAVLGDALAGIQVERMIRSYGLDVKWMESPHEEADAYVLGGGGLFFHELQEGYTGGPINSCNLVKRSLEKPFYICGTGYNGFGTIFDKELHAYVINEWKKVFSNCNGISFRDRRSAIEASKICDTTVPMEFCPDPAFRWFGEFNGSKQDGGVSFSCTYSERHKYAWDNTYIKLINDLKEITGGDVLYLPHSHSDEDAYRKLLLPNTGGRIINVKESSNNIEKFLHDLSGTKIHISTRLHGMISSFVAQVPLLNLGTSGKVSWQKDMMGWIPYYPYQFSTESLYEEIYKGAIDLLEDNDVRKRAKVLTERCRDASIFHVTKLVQELA